MKVKTSTLRVLIVDDEPLACWSLLETLAACGDVVTKANSGAAALRALCESPDPVDVVLLDYCLPDVQGLTLLSMIKRLSPSTRIVLMSAHATADIAKQALALGASDVVSKPMEMDDVPSLVHRGDASIG